jgi:phosphatidylserine/phosphatidylglycerophosphate/cardiolipin synthase-like enzyme
VRIIADHMVSDQDTATVAFLTTVHPNFQLKHYRPAMARIKPSRFQTILAGLWSFHGVNQRMHNKLMVFDGTVMITGGRNIADEYFDYDHEYNFRDRDVMLLGGAAGDGEHARIAQIALHRVVTRIPRRAPNLQSLVGHPDRHLAGQHLGLGCRQPIRKAIRPRAFRRAPNQGAGGLNLNGHIRQHPGEPLEFANGSAELAAGLGTVQSMFISPGGQPQGNGRRAHALAIIGINQPAKAARPTTGRAQHHAIGHFQPRDFRLGFRHAA